MEEVTEKQKLQTSSVTASPSESQDKLPRQHTIKHHHGLAALVILILVTVLGLSGYFFSTQTAHAPSSKVTAPSPTPISDPTANWKTYTSSDFSFSIKYPEDWFAKQDEYLWNNYKQYLLILDKGPEPTTLPHLTDILTIFHISVTKNQYSTAELQKTGITENPASNGIPANNRQSYTPIKFHNYSANKRIQQTGNMVGFYPETEIIFNANGYGWDIMYPNLDGSGRHNPIYDNILSTFKFTNQTQPTDTSSWKTYHYTRDNLSFAFRYPPDWTVSNQTGEGCDGILLDPPNNILQRSTTEIDRSVVMGMCDYNGTVEEQYVRIDPQKNGVAGTVDNHKYIQISRDRNPQMDYWYDILVDVSPKSSTQNFLDFYLMPGSNAKTTELEATMNQILSTFKFIQ